MITKTEGQLNREQRELFRAILQLESIEECEAFFQDLCTPAELAALTDRWRVAKLIAKGVAYRDIYGRTGVSTATVTRVARSVSRGAGGYRVLLERGGHLKDAR